MTIRLPSLFAILVFSSLASGQALQPDAGQKALIERGYGMFIHFRVNTFNQIEWSDGKLPASSFNPTQLDCDQWIRTAKEAGFRHVILITKHHDGFCLWDSKFTEYDVASAKVKTDIVAEVAKACKTHGVKLGLYYSLWDRKEPTHNDKDPAKYVGFMKNQLTELLTNYGDICEMWFDGGWAKPDADWRIDEVYAHIKKLQPDCQVTVNHTICISDRWNWFQKKDIIPARTPDELEELFYWCTANDNVLLVNLPPDQTGRIRENEREAIFKTADLLGIRGGKTPLPKAPVNQASGVAAEADSVLSEDQDASKAVDGSLERTRWTAKTNTASLTLTPEKPFLFDRISIHEHSEMKPLGDKFSQLRLFRAQEFSIDALQNGKWNTIHSGTEIGAAKVLRFPKKIEADKLRLRVTKASAPPGIHLITVADSSTRMAR